MSRLSISSLGFSNITNKCGQNPVSRRISTERKRKTGTNFDFLLRLMNNDSVILSTTNAMAYLFVSTIDGDGTVTGDK